jgi:hypothetical protein
MSDELSLIYIQKIGHMQMNNHSQLISSRSYYLSNKKVKY